MLRPLSGLLVLSILLGTPGLPAYQAAAAVVTRPMPAGAAAVAWRGAVANLLKVDAAAPLYDMTPRLRGVLGNIRYALDSRTPSPEALAFVGNIPPGSPMEPAAFAARVPAEQLAILEAATLRTFQEMQPQARELVERAREGVLSEADRAKLRELESVWYYLDPDTGRTIQRLARADRETRGLQLGLRLASALNPEKAAEKIAAQRKAEAAESASNELTFILAGAGELAKADSARLGRPGVNAPAGGYTREVLAPYMERALDAAAERHEQRGLSRDSFYELILAGHSGIWGGRAAKPALKLLRPAGEWTEFVAAATLHAASRLAGATGADTLNVLKKAAADGDLLLPIPSWRPEAGAAASVRDLLASRHGAQAPEFSTKGRLFTAFGIPVRADLGFYAFAAFTAWQLSHQFFAHAANPLLLAGAAVALIYATLLGHEFAHALTARRFGVATHGISLNFLGGAAHIEREPRRPLAEFLIAFAGPAFNLVYAAAVLPLALWVLPHGPVAGVLAFSAWANIVLGVLNLAPAYPMDGGRLLRSGLAAALKDHYKASRAAGVVGMALGLALTYYGWNTLVLSGNWAALFNVMIGMFVFAGSRSAMNHPGTLLVDPQQPDKAPR